MTMFNKRNIFNKLLFIILIFYSCDNNSLNINPEDGNEYEYSNFILDLDETGSHRLDGFNAGISSRTYIGYTEDNSEIYAIYSIDLNAIVDSGFCTDTTIISIDEIGFKVIAAQDLFSIYDNNIDSIDYSINNLISNELFGPASHLKAYFVTSDNLNFNEEDTLNHSSSHIEQIESYFNNYDCSSYENQNNCLLDAHFTNFQLSFLLNDIYNSDNNQIISQEEICESANASFYILLKYNNPDNSFENRIELFSTDHSIGILNPSLYIKYQYFSSLNSSINKFSIDSIFSNYLNPTSIIYNNNIDSDGFGTILSFDIDEFDLNILDEDFNNYEGNLNTIISANDSISNILNIEISLNNQIIDSLQNINFYFDDIFFTYRDFDPSNDNWSEVDSLGEEGNYQYDLGENFNDYGFDGCPDEEESGDNSCSAQNSLYNIDGTEMNNLLDWEDDGDGIWNEGEGEEWFDYGYDQVDDDFESGCSNDSYPYGIPISIPYTYDEIFIQGNNLIGLSEDFYSYTFQNDEECEEAYIEEECAGNNYCIWSESLNTCSNMEIIICGNEYWSEINCYTCSTNDPNGDNYNNDPSLDDYNIDMNPNGTENNGEYDLGEPFLDFGIDQISDSLETQIAYDYIDDNWSENNPSGTEGNNSYDFGEIFFDTGLDSLFSSNEINYNIVGKQNNQVFDYSILYIEKFNDYGVDNIVDGEVGDTDDNYNADPNDDNYHYIDNIEGLDSNGIWDFNDFGEDGCTNEYETGNQWDNNICSDLQYETMQSCLCSNLILNNQDEDLNIDDYNIDDNPTGTENNNILDANEAYEFWEDNGSDGLIDSLENNYYNNLVDIALGNNTYNLIFEDIININDSLLFDIPIIDSDDQLTLWISKIKKTDVSKFEINININSLVDITGFQFQLEHYPYVEIIDSSETKQSNYYPYEFVDQNNNSFPDDSELVDGGIKYIKDYSIYEFSDLISDSLSISYANGVIAKFSFLGLDTFLNNNKYSLISEDLSNLIIHIDKENDDYYIDPDNGVSLDFMVYDELEQKLIPFEILDSQTGLSLLPVIDITEDTDSLVIPIAHLIQKLILDEISFDSWIYLKASDYSDNFSNIPIIKQHTTKFPKLNIFYLK